MIFKRSVLLASLVLAHNSLRPVKATCNPFFITGCYFDCQSNGIAADPYDGIENILECVAQGSGFSNVFLFGDMQSKVWDCPGCGGACTQIISGRFPPRSCRESQLPSCLRLEGNPDNCCPTRFTTDELTCSLYDTTYCGGSRQLSPLNTSITSCERRQACGFANETCVDRQFDGTRCVDFQGGRQQRELGNCQADGSPSPAPSTEIITPEPTSPSSWPTTISTTLPTAVPTKVASEMPSTVPTMMPTTEPSNESSDQPSSVPTMIPTKRT